jgi:thiol:disulfide interchange protein DsbA
MGKTYPIIKTRPSAPSLHRPLKALLPLLLTLLAVVLSPTLAPAAETESLYSFGQGPMEIYIFSDYFCPPCQGVEPYLENALPELFDHGAKISFIDMPIHQPTPIYSRYYLYAAKASAGLEPAIKARSALFELAKTKAVTADSELIQELKKQEIKIRLLDTKDVFAQWRDLIQRFNITSTPTCVVVAPGQPERRFVGGGDIREGLDQLRKDLPANNT